MRIRFRAGTPTPDDIDFRWNGLTGTTQVSVNGNRVFWSLSVSDRGSPTGGELAAGDVEGFEIDRFTQGWRFQVGADGSSIVIVLKQRPRWFGICRRHHFTVKVNDDTVLETSGR